MAADLAQHNHETLLMLQRAIQLSLGEFSLILLRCNYRLLQQQMDEMLRSQLAAAGQEVRMVSLSPQTLSLATALEGAIAPPSESTGTRLPDVMVVAGLDQIKDLDGVLALANHTRDRLRQNLPFPVVLWVNDALLHAMARGAADLRSWAASPMSLEAADDTLETFLVDCVDRALAATLASPLGASLRWFRPRPEPTNQAREIAAARADLALRDRPLSPELQAGLQFLSGHGLRSQGRYTEAVVAYEASLTFWQPHADHERAELLRQRELSQIPQGMAIPMGEGVIPVPQVEQGPRLGTPPAQTDPGTTNPASAAISSTPSPPPSRQEPRTPTTTEDGPQELPHSANDNFNNDFNDDSNDRLNDDSNDRLNDHPNRQLSDNPHRNLGGDLDGDRSGNPNNNFSRNANGDSNGNSKNNSNGNSNGDFSDNSRGSSKLGGDLGGDLGGKLGGKLGGDTYGSVSGDSKIRVSSTASSPPHSSSTEQPDRPVRTAGRVPVEHLATAGQGDINHRVHPLDGSRDDPMDGNSMDDPMDGQPLGAIARCAILQFHLGLCYYQQGQRDRLQQRPLWELARQALQSCVQGLDLPEFRYQAGYFALAWAEILQMLAQWDALEPLVRRSLAGQRVQMPRIHQSRYYGFLAETALQQGRWYQAEREARQALNLFSQVLGQLGNPSGGRGAMTPSLDHILKTRSPNPLTSLGHLDPESLYGLRSLQSLYLLLLAEAQWHLKESVAAIAYLEQARGFLRQTRDLDLSLRILNLLRRLYFAQGRYLDAFQVKQELQSVEHQHGLRAFIGASQLRSHSATSNPNDARMADVAPEITASGRQQDLQRILERIARPDRRLTVIHGPSGVGKSSLVKAGLLPALRQQAIGERLALPILVEVYTNWISTLHATLFQAEHDDLDQALETWDDLEIHPDSLPPASPPTDLDQKLQEIRDRLRHNAEHNLLTILIFDQFEEFFFRYPNPRDRQPCFELLRDCLNLPYVKVILSLREDYLHCLLEWERNTVLDAIDDNVLDRHIRYRVGDFSPADARLTIQTLSDRAHLPLEPQLIDAVVADLARETGQVHPIELQIVGAQLQSDGITTLHQYQREYGSKDPLVRRYLENTIRDCGPASEDLAWDVLYQLTHDNGTRPLKTRTELISALTATDSELMPVLDILAGAGLIVIYHEANADFYQLVHDYLVGFIRQQREAAEKARHRLTQAQLNRILKKRVQELYAAGVVLSMLLLSSMGFAFRLAVGEANAQIDATSTYAEALLGSEQPFDALTASLHSWQQRQQPPRSWLVWAHPRTRFNTRLKIASSLQQSLDRIREQNRLEGHTNIVWDVSYSPDGQTIATASTDHTVRLWKPTGELITILEGPNAHQSSVTNAAFSPDGQWLATAGGSDEPVVKLWKPDGTFVGTIAKHDDSIFCVTFSPDSQTIATASKDGTARLWSLDGRLLQTFRGHTAPVEWITFSPNGQTIATASDDSTVRLWNRVSGATQAILKGHQHWVYSVAFSPDGQELISASTDNTIKIWSATGTLRKTLPDQGDRVYNLAYSPDGKTFASTSEDKTVKLWTRDGKLLHTFRGHTDRVTSVAFSPDGQTLASSSYDKTVRLWQIRPPQSSRKAAHSDRIHALDISPDGQRVVSAGADSKLKLWSRDGKLLNAITDPNNRIADLAIHPDGNTVITGGSDGKLRLWDMAQGKLLRTWDGQPSPSEDPDPKSRELLAVTFSPQGDAMASAGRDGQVRLWDLQGQLLHELVPPEVPTAELKSVNAIAFSPNGQAIATASDDTKIRLWNRDGTLTKSLTGHGNYVADVAFSPDGRYLASAGGDNIVRLWTSDGNPLELFGHNDSVNSVRFSQDSRFLVSGSWDGTVVLWDLTGTQLKVLKEHTDSASRVRLSRDGGLLVSASFDQTLIFRNLNLDQVLYQSCAWLDSYLQNNPTVDRNDRHLCEAVLLDGSGRSPEGD